MAMGDLCGKHVNPQAPKSSRYLVFDKNDFYPFCRKSQTIPS